jgi:hypothetical protein
MSKIADKVKEKLKSGKDKVMDVGEGAKDKVVGDDSTERRTSDYGSTAYEEGARGTEKGRKDDPLTSYRDKGMAKGTAGAAETESEYEQDK